jgi:hypothetical protein
MTTLTDDIPQRDVIRDSVTLALALVVLLVCSAFAAASAAHAAQNQHAREAIRPSQAAHQSEPEEGEDSHSTDGIDAPAALVSVVISPTVASLPVGAPQFFVAAGYDEFNNPIPGLTFTWSVSPTAGALEYTGADNAVFRAGTTAGRFDEAVRASTGGLSAAADVRVLPGPAASIMVAPGAVTLAISATQVFTASVFDMYGNLLPAGVAWSTSSPDVGAVESSGPFAATFRAGIRAGSHARGLSATNGSASGGATITIPPDPPAQLQVSAMPDSIRTDGLSPSTIVVTVTDNFDNHVGAGAPVTLSVDACPGSCVLAPLNGVTDGEGHVTATLTSDHRSALGTMSTIKVGAAIATPGGLVTRTATIAGSFTPFVTVLPATSNGPPRNHTACTAYPLSAEMNVSQAADNAFNIYRFTATATTYNVSISNYATQGRFLLYRIVADNCAQSANMSVAFLDMIDIGSPTLFQIGLSEMFTPGDSYLLAVNTTGALTSRVYTLAIWP